MMFAGLRGKVFWVVLLCVPWAAPLADEVYARVNNKVLTQGEVDSAVYMAARQRFYHGRADESRVAQLRRQVVGELIDQLLLIDEAERRQLAPTQEEEAHRYQVMLSNYRLESVPRDHRVQLEAALQQQAREQLQIEMLEAQVKNVAEPDAETLQAFYRQHLDRFTTPPRLHLSVILLKVAPSAPSQVWQAAVEEAQQIKIKLDAGADFAELAQLHSSDPSAERGGDLGFVHQGMLTEEAQQAVDELTTGEVTLPVVLLQGVALFRVENREAAKINPFDLVRERALGLWRREEAGRAWEALLRDLRARAKIEIIGGEMTAAMIWAQQSVVR